MRIVTYTPEMYDLVREAALRVNNPNLLHRPFVDYYYTSHEGCRLFLFLGKDGNVAGTLGLDRMTFQYRDQLLTAGIASNFYALQPGSGGYLFLHWLKCFPFGMVFGGSEDTHAILRSQKWTYYSGIQTYALNWGYPAYSGDPAWRRSAKWLLRRLTIRRIGAYARRLPADRLAATVVKEEREYVPDLLPRRSPFAFRFVPDVSYLAWRYNLNLSFVRYRLFRIVQDGAPAGYVILNETKEQILVAQCDGEEGETLAWGVLLAVIEAGRRDRQARTVQLTCSHPVLSRVFAGFGFRALGERPLAVGSLRHPVALSSNTGDWLVNLDWSDNGLRAPFLDQVAPLRGT